MSIRKASALLSLAGLLLAVSVSPASAHRAYASGMYSGTVKQAIPHTYAGAISFRVRAHKISMLRFNVTMVCSKALIAQVAAPASKLKIKVSRDGRFSYTGKLHGTKLKLHGRVRGHTARGMFFESFRTAPGHRCTMLAPAPFRTRV